MSATKVKTSMDNHGYSGYHEPGIISLGENGTILYANEIALSYAARENVVGKKFTDCYPQLNPGRQRDSFTKKINNKSYFFSVSYQKVPVTDGTNTLVTIIDVTAQNKLQQENALLEQSLMLYKTILDSIDEGILALDKSGHIVFMNSTQEKIDNLKFSEIKGCHITKKYDFDNDSSILLKIINTGNRIPHQPQYYLTGGEHAVNIVTSCSPLFNKTELIGAVSISQDFNLAMHIFQQINKLIEQKQKCMPKEDAINESKKYKLNGTQYTFDDIIGKCEVHMHAIEKAKRASISSSNILIYGSTGTGKELFAQSIHNASSRSKEPFVAINCAALPDTLLESILFGTAKGAFTGSVDRPGLFEQASTGTLFLDEINSMPLFLQAKLLRVIQEGRVRRIGGIAEKNVSPRIIGSLNIEPQKAIDDERLRADLYYRLAVVTIYVPTLSERYEDIPLLTNFFIAHYNQMLNRNVKISVNVLNTFKKYSWPGNIRELQHVIEGSMNTMPDNEHVLLMKHLPLNIFFQLHNTNKLHHESNITRIKRNIASLDDDDLPLPKSLKSNKESVEIQETLASTHWNISESARLLGISRQNLQYRIKKYNIKVEHSIDEKS